MNPISIKYKTESKFNVELFPTFADLLVRKDLYPHIIDLNVVDHGLTQLPDEICEFTELEKLNCSNNYITLLPMGLSRLVKLTEITAINNRLIILPPEIGKLENLRRLDVQYNQIDSLPPSFADLKALRFVNFNNNNFHEFPDPLGSVRNLETLYMSHNRIKRIPQSIGGLVNIRTLSFYGNRICSIHNLIKWLRHIVVLNLTDNCLGELPETIGELVTLERLLISNNVHLKEIPRTIGDCRALHTLEANNNQLERLPVEITQCTALRTIETADNPIEITPIVQRFINRHRNIRNHAGLYGDTQNVHASSIQESIKKSLITLFNDRYEADKDTVVAVIVEDPAIQIKNKQILIGYIKDDKETHSTLYCTFFDAFMKVYGRIRGVADDGRRAELYKRLNEELDEAECRCFTGRLSRMVNVLVGFFDDIEVCISENEQISNVILAIRRNNGLDVEDEMDEPMKERIRQELRERGYEDDIIEVWLNV
jgi:Leucine-rich repeat (LRR) protein